jgi:hypothetical protein
MKSKIIILIVAIVLVPILIGATPLSLASKMAGGCPFKQRPMFERCNPTVIHSTVSPDNLSNISLPLAPLSSPLPAFPKIQIVDLRAALSLDALTPSPLRC